MGSDDGYEVIYVNRILKGAWFQEGEALEASGISVGIEHLPHWVQETGIRERVSWLESGGLLEEAAGHPRYELKAFDIPKREAALQTGATVSLIHRLGTDGDPLDRRSLTKSFSWRIDLPEGRKRPMEDVLDPCQRPTRFDLDCDHAPSAVSTFVQFSHPDLEREGTGGERHHGAVDFYARWNIRPSANRKAAPPNQMLFSFHQLGGMEGIKRWMDTVEPYRSGLGRVAATIYSDGMLVSDRLLNCAAALEAFDRLGSKQDKRDFKVRLMRCATLAGEPFEKLVSDIQRWADMVVAERNEVAHHFGRKARTSDSETYDLWRSLFYLYILCLLREAAAPGAVFTQIQQHADYILLMDRVKDLI
jgi:hypothetical protein